MGAGLGLGMDAGLGVGGLGVSGLGGLSGLGGGGLGGLGSSGHGGLGMDTGMMGGGYSGSSDRGGRREERGSQRFTRPDNCTVQVKNVSTVLPCAAFPLCVCEWVCVFYMCNFMFAVDEEFMRN